MTALDYVIRGAGCSGLSLAYEMDLHGLLDHHRLAIVDPRAGYERDKTWSFWSVSEHNFKDCVVGRWSRFRVNTGDTMREVPCEGTPYESIDSGLFYEKVLARLKKNPRIQFVRDPSEVDETEALVFNSVPDATADSTKTWQHFKGIEVQTDTPVFDPDTVTLMDFDCDQRDQVHFYYVLPFARNRALIETTWLGPLDVGRDDYDVQLQSYVQRRFGAGRYTVVFKEQGAIPLFEMSPSQKGNVVNIGSNGGMTRLSTGYAFLNIQEHSRYIRQNIDEIKKRAPFQIGSRYRMLDKIFLRVLASRPELMPSIFGKFFSGRASDAIAFLSNTGRWQGDLSTIWQMPKGPFMLALLGL